MGGFGPSHRKSIVRPSLKRGILHCMDMTCLREGHMAIHIDRRKFTALLGAQPLQHR